MLLQVVLLCLYDVYHGFVLDFQVYFSLVFIMVMVSIITLGYSTEPYLRRALSKCELLEYMEHTGNVIITCWVLRLMVDVSI